MKDQKKLLYVIIAVVAVVVIGVIMAGGKKTNTASTTPAKSSSSSKADTASAVATMSIDIKDYMFGPMVTKVKVGDTVTWTNKDAVHHNIVADTASADAPNGPLFGQNETYSFKFTKAGSFSYHCEPHPYMHGTVVVE